jgi:hypothetical protein
MPRQIGIGHLNCQFYDLAFFYSLLSPIDSLFFGPQAKKIGVIGFEPTTLWSQTRCASQTALHPVSPHYVHKFRRVR